MGRQWLQKKRGLNAEKRAKITSKLAREITVAAKMGAPDPAFNPRLALSDRVRAQTVGIQRRHRACGQEGQRPGRRRGQFRAGHVRGHVAPERARDHRVPDRQPQPHRARYAHAVQDAASARRCSFFDHPGSSRPDASDASLISKRLRSKRARTMSRRSRRLLRGSRCASTRSPPCSMPSPPSCARPVGASPSRNSASVPGEGRTDA
ncbi:MAG: YebC/PmpR family DNA-binding transcriptional regulator [Planctomycetes bacterium]|nr:YebC/PmpR family DNA-binding transcriptional regulator [Planctomycetota bacterium]